MEEKHTIEDRYVVYEYNEKASPSYRGCRFMTSWDGPEDHDPESNTNIIAENVSLENAQFLISMAKKDSIESFFENLPDELKAPSLLRFLKNL
jgi:patatin-like phospholipase/acyl hydrolase